MVSVIIPNYNHSRFLRQRIDSVLSQSYTNIEVILLDDCSSDNSIDIIESYRNHPKVSQIVRNKQNSGSVFKQWKKGIELAKGEYIWIAESDDFAEKSFLSEILQVIEADNKIGLAYCNSKVVDENNQSTGTFKTLNDLRKYMFNTSLWNNSFIIDGSVLLDKYLSKRCVINNASAVVFKKSALDTLAINIDEYKYAGDWAVYVDLATKFKIAFLNEELSFYRDHKGNASKNAHINLAINFENYSIISNYYDSLKTKREKSKYVYSVRRAFLHVLITSDEREKIFSKYKSRNKQLLMRSLKYIPQVFLETYFSLLLQKVSSALKK